MADNDKVVSPEEMQEEEIVKEEEKTAETAEAAEAAETDGEAEAAPAEDASGQETGIALSGTTMESTLSSTSWKRRTA